MLELGPVSSLFDIVTFAALFFVVCPAAVDASWSELAAAGDVAGMATFAALFQSGWFVESMWSQTLVVHMLRSPHLPSPHDHAAPAYRLYRAHPAGKAPLHCPPRRAAVASRRKTPCQLPLPLPQLPPPQSIPPAVAVK